MFHSLPDSVLRWWIREGFVLISERIFVTCTMYASATRVPSVLALPGASGGAVGLSQSPSWKRVSSHNLSWPRATPRSSQAVML